ncbi:MAG TPA: helix-turn-helix domain-containing protein [Chitinophagaceae bacterium]|nr:helix-turn-helix domain-containing protein [Chitinophagaceae bacterium]
MSTFTPDTSNTLFQLAADLVNQSNRNIFLTGKAGTGKTTFLKYIRDNCPKQMAIVAPTGVAAINAGGVTIHSFFQIPPCIFLPTLQRTGFANSTSNTEVHNRHSLPARLRFNHDKRKILQQLELLIIDEISMVRCDLLDAIDTVLRHIRKRHHEKFGGVQVVFIGDMFQLPPVVKETDWKLLSEFYNSAYFFDSLVIKEEQPLYIEFDKIYRQSEEKFIRVLNQVRNNELDETGLMILESCYNPSVRRKKDDGYIILTTHNDQARNINVSQLQQLVSPPVQYDALITDDFPGNAYPADETLYLKVGAQVMFIKNDIADRGKRYFNGKIGIVTKLEEDAVFVECDEIEIKVEREKWENIRYSLDKTSQTMKEDVLGSFTQFPLRLAWAITIHKSQGLTFDKVIIDAGEAFAPGQVYVALSRCTSLNGLVLKSKIRTGSLLTDPRIIQFARNSSSSSELQNELSQAKKEYQLRILIDSFNYHNAINNAVSLKDYILENIDSFNKEAADWIEKLLNQLYTLQDTAVKFHNWLQGQFLQPETPEENTVMLERTIKASAHFDTELEILINLLENPALVTDSKLHAKECNELLKDIFAGLSSKKHLIKGFSGKIDIAAWHQRKRNFVLASFPVNVYAGAATQKTDSPHPALYIQLKKQRDAFCEKRDLPVYMVANSQTLDEMSRYLPQSLEEMKKIGGMGESKIRQYGQAFLDIILEYCYEHDLSSHIYEKTPKRERKQKAATARKKGDSHAESFRLLKEGKTIAEIAKERNLTMGTIEGHLCKFIRSKEISVEDLVSKEKIFLIESALKDFDGSSTAPIKQKLPPEITFGEIKMVMAALGIMQQRKEDKANA